MKNKAIKRERISTHSRTLSTIGVAGLLSFTIIASYADTTNNSPPGTFSQNIVYQSKIPQPAVLISTPKTDANEMANRLETTPPITRTPDLLPAIQPVNASVTDDLTAESGTLQALSNSVTPSTIEGPLPIFGPNFLVLEAPDLQLLNHSTPWAEASLNWGKLLVQFFAPDSVPSPPGGHRETDWSESNRPWPVIAAGAAAGNSWNDPGLYQAHGFLLICW